MLHNCPNIKPNKTQLRIFNMSHFNGYKVHHRFQLELCNSYFFSIVRLWKLGRTWCWWLCLEPWVPPLVLLCTRVWKPITKGNSKSLEEKTCQVQSSFYTTVEGLWDKCNVDAWRMFMKCTLENVSWSTKLHAKPIRLEPQKSWLV